MEKTNNIAVIRKIFNILGIGFSCLAIIMIGVGIIANNFNEDFYNAAQSTAGRVESTSSDPAKTVIAYQVDGKEYNEKLNSYSSSVNQGDEITVYYNKDNPKEMKVKELAGIFSFVFYILGGVFLFIGVITVIVVNAICYSMVKKDKKQLNY